LWLYWAFGEVIEEVSRGGWVCLLEVCWLVWVAYVLVPGLLGVGSGLCGRRGERVRNISKYTWGRRVGFHALHCRMLSCVEVGGDFVCLVCVRLPALGPCL
jgi:hypothetical protein